ncbi:MAG: ATP-binding protein [Steroidobacteraceae bacterium]
MTSSSGTMSDGRHARERSGAGAAGTLIGADRAREAITVGVGVLFAVVMGIVLLVGSRLAKRVTLDVAALQTASGLETYPAILNQQITQLRDRLEERAYSGQALSDLRVTSESFTRDLGRLESSRIGSSSELAQALKLWGEFRPVLGPVTAFSGQPYIDTDQGSTFSPGGREHYANVKRAQLFAHETSPQLTRDLGSLSSQLQTQANAEAAQLRLLLSGGVIFALVLAGVAAYLQVTGAKLARAARESEEQTRDILSTVREGFFLLDADYRIGAVWSDALTRLFGRRDFAGLPFEELLQGLVSSQTLATATKYIKLLWGERAHENLMKSINPLGQLEIHLDNGHGGQDTRFLQFDFHRVLGPKGAVKHVLVSVSDITSSVLLARELAESQESANAQVDMMMGVMHLDPVQLGAFLDSTETGLTLINAILKEPARTDADFRKKLDGMFRELHSIKGESSAINLMTVAQRVHALEDSVSDLKKAPALSGNEFLPLVVKLDELMAHLKMIRELAARFSSLREGGPGAPEGDGGAAPRRPDELSQTLQQLASRLAGDHQKNLRLDLSGLGEVPPAYRGTLKDVLIQMLRNAAVHGIETAEVRRAHTKDGTGVVRIEFGRKTDGFELMFEDDGAGISPEQLKAAAVRRQLVTQQEADGMDTRAAMALIFRPGFSTHDQVSMDAGRGVGMDVVARNVYALGGRIGVSTSPGKFTRFKISLPIAPARADSAVA